jgi:malonate-semialdehyde dehydrogenase (acetylating)/methylmalonate-semialdehyde dehydrogenase
MNFPNDPVLNAVTTAKLLINGEFVESKTTEWRDIVNPATQEVIGRVPFATSAEVETAINSAHEAFKTWRNTSVGARTRIMLKYQALIREHLPRIAKILSAEQGKTVPDAEGDIFRGLEVVEHAASIGTLQQGDFLENVAGKVDTYTLRQPIGVCAGRRQDARDRPRRVSATRLWYRAVRQRGTSERGARHADGSDFTEGSRPAR